MQLGEDTEQCPIVSQVTILDFWLRASCMVMMFAKRSEGSPSAEQNTLMCFSYSTSIRVTNLHNNNYDDDDHHHQYVG